MDTRDDPNTTTTTDYDSGDSEGVEYVYEGKKGAAAAKKPIAKQKSPGRRRSRNRRRRRRKSRLPVKCVCGAAAQAEDDDVESTVSEDSDTEEEEEEEPGGPEDRPAKDPEQPSEPRDGASGSEKEDQPEPRPKPERKKTAGKKKKARRERSPYIEEYPEEPPAPAIRLKEHRIPRMSAAASEARRVRDCEERSPSLASRGRSPAGRRLPRLTHRRSSDESPPKRRGRGRLRRRHRLEFPEKREGNVKSTARGDRGKVPVGNGKG